MNRLASYHVHTTFCDGSQTPEEMVISAISQNMTDIGFTAHSAWPFSTEWHMAPQNFQKYREEIQRLKTLYAEKITIHCGFEADYINGITWPDKTFYKELSPAFLIGSVHYVPCPTRFGKNSIKFPMWCADAPEKEVALGIEKCFSGNGKRAVCAYYGTVREMIESCDFDILGHPDIFRKRNKALKFFCETDSWYQREIRKTIKTIAQKGILVEMNTGAISRGAMDGIYPSDEFLSLLNKADIPIVLNSDAHTADGLICAYDRAKEAARKAGYKTLSYLESTGWEQHSF